MLSLLCVLFFDLTLSFSSCRLKETRKLRSEMKKTPSTVMKVNLEQQLTLLDIGMKEPIQQHCVNTDMKEPIKQSENVDSNFVNFPSPVVKLSLHANDKLYYIVTSLIITISHFPHPGVYCSCLTTKV